MIVLSIIVTLWIIQMSLAERAINDAAIKINSIVSLLHGPGIMIPINEKMKKINFFGNQSQRVYEFLILNKAEFFFL